MATAYEQLAGWLDGRTEAERNAILSAHLYCQLRLIIGDDMRDLAAFCSPPGQPLDDTMDMLNRVVRPLLIPVEGGLSFPTLYRERARAHAKREAQRARWRRQKAAQRAKLTTPPQYVHADTKPPPRYVHMDIPQYVHADTKPPPRYVHMDIPQYVHADTQTPPPVCPRGQENVHVDNGRAVHADIAETSEPQGFAHQSERRNVHVDTPPARACSNSAQIYGNSSSMHAREPTAAASFQEDEITSTVYQRLEAHGVSPRTIQRLVAKFGPSRCAEQADYLEHKQAQGHDVRNPAGYLRRAIEVGYRRPGGYVSQNEKAANQAEQQRQRQQRQREHQAQEIRRRARRGFYRAMADRWAELPDARKQSIATAVGNPRDLEGSIDTYDALAQQLGITHPDDLPITEAGQWLQCAPTANLAVHQGLGATTDQGGNHGTVVGANRGDQQPNRGSRLRAGGT